MHSSKDMAHTKKHDGRMDGQTESLMHKPKQNTH